jgi:hypothetical protein
VQVAGSHTGTFLAPLLRGAPAQPKPVTKARSRAKAVARV